MATEAEVPESVSATTEEEDGYLATGKFDITVNQFSPVQLKKSEGEEDQRPEPVQCFVEGEIAHVESKNGISECGNPLETLSDSKVDKQEEDARRKGEALDIGEASVVKEEDSEGFSAVEHSKTNSTDHEGESETNLYDNIQPVTYELARPKLNSEEDEAATLREGTKTITTAEDERQVVKLEQSCEEKEKAEKANTSYDTIEDETPDEQNLPVASIRIVTESEIAEVGESTISEPNENVERSEVLNASTVKCDEGDQGGTSTAKDDEDVDTGTAKVAEDDEYTSAVTIKETSAKVTPNDDESSPQTLQKCDSGEELQHSREVLPEETKTETSRENAEEITCTKEETTIQHTQEFLDEEKKEASGNTSNLEDDNAREEVLETSGTKQETGEHLVGEIHTESPQDFVDKETNEETSREYQACVEAADLRTNTEEKNLEEQAIPELSSPLVVEETATEIPKEEETAVLILKEEKKEEDAESNEPAEVASMTHETQSETTEDTTKPNKDLSAPISEESNITFAENISTLAEVSETETEKSIQEKDGLAISFSDSASGEVSHVTGLKEAETEKEEHKENIDTVQEEKGQATILKDEMASEVEDIGVQAEENCELKEQLEEHIPTAADKVETFSKEAEAEIEEQINNSDVAAEEKVSETILTNERTFDVEDTNMQAEKNVESNENLEETIPTAADEGETSLQEAEAKSKDEIKSTDIAHADTDGHGDEIDNSEENLDKQIPAGERETNLKAAEAEYKEQVKHADIVPEEKGLATVLTDETPLDVEGIEVKTDCVEPKESVEEQIPATADEGEKSTYISSEDIEVQADEKIITPENLENLILTTSGERETGLGEAEAEIKEQVKSIDIVPEEMATISTAETPSDVEVIGVQAEESLKSKENVQEQIPIAADEGGKFLKEAEAENKEQIDEENLNSQESSDKGKQEVNETTNTLEDDTAREEVLEITSTEQDTGEHVVHEIHTVVEPPPDSIDKETNEENSAGYQASTDAADLSTTAEEKNLQQHDIQELSSPLVVEEETNEIPRDIDTAAEEMGQATILKENIDTAPEEKGQATILKGETASEVEDIGVQAEEKCESKENLEEHIPTAADKVETFSKEAEAENEEQINNSDVAAEEKVLETILTNEKSFDVEDTNVQAEKNVDSNENMEENIPTAADEGETFPKEAEAESKDEIKNAAIPQADIDGHGDEIDSSEENLDKQIPAGECETSLKTAQAEYEEQVIHADIAPEEKGLATILTDETPLNVEDIEVKTEDCAESKDNVEEQIPTTADEGEKSTYISHEDFEVQADENFFTLENLKNPIPTISGEREIGLGEAETEIKEQVKSIGIVPEEIATISTAGTPLDVDDIGVQAEESLKSKDNVEEQIPTAADEGENFLKEAAAENKEQIDEETLNSQESSDKEKEKVTEITNTKDDTEREEVIETTSTEQETEERVVHEIHTVPESPRDSIDKETNEDNSAEYQACTEAADLSTSAEEKNLEEHPIRELSSPLVVEEATNETPKEEETYTTLLEDEEKEGHATCNEPNDENEAEIEKNIQEKDDNTVSNSESLSGELSHVTALKESETEINRQDKNIDTAPEEKGQATISADETASEVEDIDVQLKENLESEENLEEQFPIAADEGEIISKEAEAENQEQIKNVDAQAEKTVNSEENIDKQIPPIAHEGESLKETAVLILKEEKKEEDTECNEPAEVASMTHETQSEITEDITEPNKEENIDTAPEEKGQATILKDEMASEVEDIGVQAEENCESKEKLEEHIPTAADKAETFSKEVEAENEEQINNGDVAAEEKVSETIVINERTFEVEDTNVQAEKNVESNENLEESIPTAANEGETSLQEAEAESKDEIKSTDIAHADTVRHGDEIDNSEENLDKQIPAGERETSLKAAEAEYKEQVKHADIVPEEKGLGTILTDETPLDVEDIEVKTEDCVESKENVKEQIPTTADEGKKSTRISHEDIEVQADENFITRENLENPIPTTSGEPETGLGEAEAEIKEQDKSIDIVPEEMATNSIAETPLDVEDIGVQAEESLQSKENVEEQIPTAADEGEKFLKEAEAENKEQIDEETLNSQESSDKEKEEVIEITNTKDDTEREEVLETTSIAADKVETFSKDAKAKNEEQISNSDVAAEEKVLETILTNEKSFDVEDTNVQAEKNVESNENLEETIPTAADEGETSLQEAEAESKNEIKSIDIAHADTVGHGDEIDNSEENLDKQIAAGESETSLKAGEKSTYISPEDFEVQADENFITLENLEKPILTTSCERETGLGEAEAEIKGQVKSIDIVPEEIATISTAETPLDVEDIGVQAEETLKSKENVEEHIPTTADEGERFLKEAKAENKEQIEEENLNSQKQVTEIANTIEDDTEREEVLETTSMEQETGEHVVYEIHTVPEPPRDSIDKETNEDNSVEYQACTEAADLSTTAEEKNLEEHDIQELSSPLVVGEETNEIPKEEETYATLLEEEEKEGHATCNEPTEKYEAEIEKNIQEKDGNTVSNSESVSGELSHVTTVQDSETEIERQDKNIDTATKEKGQATILADEPALEVEDIDVQLKENLESEENLEEQFPIAADEGEIISKEAEAENQEQIKNVDIAHEDVDAQAEKTVNSEENIDKQIPPIAHEGETSLKEAEAEDKEQAERSFESKEEFVEKIPTKYETFLKEAEAETKEHVKCSDIAPEEKGLEDITDETSLDVIDIEVKAEESFESNENLEKQIPTAEGEGETRLREAEPESDEQVKNDIAPEKKVLETISKDEMALDIDDAYVQLQADENSDTKEFSDEENPTAADEGEEKIAHENVVLNDTPGVQILEEAEPKVGVEEESCKSEDQPEKTSTIVEEVFDESKITGRDFNTEEIVEGNVACFTQESIGEDTVNKSQEIETENKDLKEEGSCIESLKEGSGDDLSPEYIREDESETLKDDQKDAVKSEGEILKESQADGVDESITGEITMIAERSEQIVTLPVKYEEGEQGESSSPVLKEEGSNEKLNEYQVSSEAADSSTDIVGKNSDEQESRELSSSVVGEDTSNKNSKQEEDYVLSLKEEENEANVECKEPVEVANTAHEAKFETLEDCIEPKEDLYAPTSEEQIHTELKGAEAETKEQVKDIEIDHEEKGLVTILTDGAALENVDSEEFSENQIPTVADEGEYNTQLVGDKAAEESFQVQSLEEAEPKLRVEDERHESEDHSENNMIVEEPQLLEQVLDEPKSTDGNFGEGQTTEGNAAICAPDIIQEETTKNYQDTDKETENLQEEILKQPEIAGVGESTTCETNQIAETSEEIFYASPVKCEEGQPGEGSSQDSAKASKEEDVTEDDDNNGAVTVTESSAEVTSKGEEDSEKYELDEEKVPVKISEVEDAKEACDLEENASFSEKTTEETSLQKEGHEEVSELAPEKLDVVAAEEEFKDGCEIVPEADSRSIDVVSKDEVVTSQTHEKGILQEQVEITSSTLLTEEKGIETSQHEHETPTKDKNIDEEHEKEVPADGNAGDLSAERSEDGIPLQKEESKELKASELALAKLDAGDTEEGIKETLKTISISDSQSTDAVPKDEIFADQTHLEASYASVPKEEELKTYQDDRETTTQDKIIGEEYAKKTEVPADENGRDLVAATLAEETLLKEEPGELQVSELTPENLAAGETKEEIKESFEKVSKSDSQSTEVVLGDETTAYQTELAGDKAVEESFQLQSLEEAEPILRVEDKSCESEDHPENNNMIVEEPQLLEQVLDEPKSTDGDSSEGQTIKSNAAICTPEIIEEGTANNSQDSDKETENSQEEMLKETEIAGVGESTTYETNQIAESSEEISGASPAKYEEGQPGEGSSQDSAKASKDEDVTEDDDNIGAVTVTETSAEVTSKGEEESAQALEKSEPEEEKVPVKISDVADAKEVCDMEDKASFTERTTEETSLQTEGHAEVSELAPEKLDVEATEEEFKESSEIVPESDSRSIDVVSKDEIVTSQTLYEGMSQKQVEIPSSTLLTEAKEIEASQHEHETPTKDKNIEEEHEKEMPADENARDLSAERSEDETHLQKEESNELKASELALEKMDAGDTEEGIKEALKAISKSDSQSTDAVSKDEIVADQSHLEASYDLLPMEEELKTYQDDRETTTQDKIIKEEYAKKTEVPADENGRDLVAATLAEETLLKEETGELKVSELAPENLDAGETKEEIKQSFEKVSKSDSQSAEVVSGDETTAYQTELAGDKAVEESFQMQSLEEAEPKLRVEDESRESEDHPENNNMIVEEPQLLQQVLDEPKSTDGDSSDGQTTKRNAAVCTPEIIEEGTARNSQDSDKETENSQEEILKEQEIAGVGESTAYETKQIAETSEEILDASPVKYEEGRPGEGSSQDSAKVSKEEGVAEDDDNNGAVTVTESNAEVTSKGEEDSAQPSEKYEPEEEKVSVKISDVEDAKEVCDVEDKASFAEKTTEETSLQKEGHAEVSELAPEKLDIEATEEEFKEGSKIVRESDSRSIDVVSKDEIATSQTLDEGISQEQVEIPSSTLLTEAKEIEPSQHEHETPTKDKTIEEEHEKEMPADENTGDLSAVRSEDETPLPKEESEELKPSELALEKLDAGDTEEEIKETFSTISKSDSQSTDAVPKDEIVADQTHLEASYALLPKEEGLKTYQDDHETTNQDKSVEEEYAKETEVPADENGRDLVAPTMAEETLLQKEEPEELKVSELAPENLDAGETEEEIKESFEKVSKSDSQGSEVVLGDEMTAYQTLHEGISNEQPQLPSSTLVPEEKEIKISQHEHETTAQDKNKEGGSTEKNEVPADENTRDLFVAATSEEETCLQKEEPRDFKACELAPEKLDAGETEEIKETLDTISKSDSLSIDTVSKDDIVADQTLVGASYTSLPKEKEHEAGENEVLAHENGADLIFARSVEEKILQKEEPGKLKVSELAPEELNAGETEEEIKKTPERVSKPESPSTDVVSRDEAISLQTLHKGISTEKLQIPSSVLLPEEKEIKASEEHGTTFSDKNIEDNSSNLQMQDDENIKAASTGKETSLIMEEPRELKASDSELHLTQEVPREISNEEITEDEKLPEESEPDSVREESHHENKAKAEKQGEQTDEHQNKLFEVDEKGIPSEKYERQLTFEGLSIKEHDPCFVEDKTIQDGFPEEEKRFEEAAFEFDLKNQEDEINSKSSVTEETQIEKDSKNSPIVETSQEVEAKDTKSTNDTCVATEIKERIQVGTHSPEEKEATTTSKEQQIEEDEEEEHEISEDVKADEEKGENEHKHGEPGYDSPIMVEASRDADVNVKVVSHKKSNNILSGIKHSISKVKKAITGKSSHSKTKSEK